MIKFTFAKEPKKEGDIQSILRRGYLVKETPDCQENICNHKGFYKKNSWFCFELFNYIFVTQCNWEMSFECPEETFCSRIIPIYK